MKKAIVASILGLAASGIAAFGQGFIVWNNYISSTYEPVYYTPNAATAPAGQAGANVSDITTEVQLFYILGTTSDTPSEFFTDPSVTAGNTTFLLGSGTNPHGSYVGSPAAPGAVGGPGGYYNGGVQTLTAATSGETVTFGVEGWETSGTYGGSTYATSLLRGQSALWTETDIVTGTTPPNTMVNGPTPLELAIVPEPTTLAFAGMGLLSLLAIARRKNV